MLPVSSRVFPMIELWTNKCGLFASDLDAMRGAFISYHPYFCAAALSVQGCEVIGRTRVRAKGPEDADKSGFLHPVMRLVAVPPGLAAFCYLTCWWVLLARGGGVCVLPCASLFFVACQSV